MHFFRQKSTMKFLIRIIIPVQREHCRCLKHISILTMLGTPVVQGGTVGGSKESGSVVLVPVGGSGGGGDPGRARAALAGLGPAAVGGSNDNIVLKNI